MGRKWNIDLMNDYCREYANGYIVSEIKYVQKTYQNQLWALVKCPNVNHDAYWVCWNNFARGYRCKQCSYEQQGKEMWDKNKANSFFKSNGYIMLNDDDFTNTDVPVYCRDANGFIYKISITNLKRSLNTKFKFSIIKNNQYAIDNIRLYCKLYRSDYELISEKYLGVKELHIFKYIGDCLDDDVDKMFLCTIDEFIYGNVKHPMLSISNGELMVKSILSKYNVRFVQQHAFADCIDQRVLPFDFYLPHYNVCIEYQGKQHYEAVDFFGGEDSLKYVQRHDKIKHDYCIKNHINIIHLPYTLTAQQIEQQLIHIWNP